MGLRAGVMIAWRSLSRRKIKNLSAILAITLGVTLLVGIQITTDTLENSFITSLLQNEGEVDLQLANSTRGGYLTAADQESIALLVPDAIGIMPELTIQISALAASQFDPTIEAAGISPDYPEAFGAFYDWKTGEQIDINALLTDNTSILLSSNQAEKLGLNKETRLPVPVTTEFTNFTIAVTINFTSGQPIITPIQEIVRVELQVVGFYDSNRPGIGSQYSGAVFSLPHLQDWISLQDPLRETDLISAYLIAFKADHFIQEIDEEYLRTQIDLLEDAIPEEEDPQTGDKAKIYTVTSTRLNFIDLAGFFITLMSTMLSSLGFLITLTGILLITNVQLMSVEDREFQTGVLRAVGANRRGIFQSQMIETLFQGLIGGVLGFIGGMAFGQAVALYLVGLFGTGAQSVQPVFSQEAIILSFIVGIILSIITGILPALRASRVNIVEALRGIKVKLKAKSGRNLTTIGVLLSFASIILLLYNGILEKTHQVFWTSAGWDSLEEWRYLMMGFGLFTGGIGIILSRFMDRVKAFNVAAVTLWAIPSILFVVAMGKWVTDITEFSIEILILGIAEILIGSILFIALNLPIVMRGLRRILITIRGVKGVAQIAPSLISSHISRSTLTFAIFAIILTLNVVVATLIPTSLGTVTKIEEDSHGIDLTIKLSKPEAILPDTSYSNELAAIDSRITDVIGFKTFHPQQDFTKFIALNDPLSLGFDPRTDLLPIRTGEFKPEQIRGNASDSSDPDWRYAFYLDGLPDGVRESLHSEVTDEEILDLSKKAWDQFFDLQYTMAAYNITSDLLAVLSGETDLADMQIDPGGSDGPITSGGDSLKGVTPLKDGEGNIIQNPIIFTDSFLLPIGLQLWIPMNTSIMGFTNYQAFTIGGSLDSQRAGGFPLGSGLHFGSGRALDGSGFDDILGTLYLPERWANQTDFLGEANGQTAISRKSDQYDAYLIKTTLSIDDPELEDIAQAVEDFTNTNDEGYRLLADDNFYMASSTRTYARIETTLKFTDRITSFLQIYVTFGLVIGAVGMGVISVRNVSERKREIGMMRAIGFPRRQVILSVLLELVVLGIIGLLIGVVNGLLISTGFANMQNATLIIPWRDIGSYLSIIILIALGSGTLPAIAASRIPPAEALRYVG
ncbi:MAG: FtsX-like permease family protein [Candidatus Bathyarchaeota archaeon]|nr:MAG: FtsX-like permease family protein [Candidatus Bathyarchaeota archaeon]